MSDKPSFAQELHDFFRDLVPFLQNLDDPGFRMTTDLPDDPGPHLARAGDLAAYVAKMPGLEEKETGRYGTTALGVVFDAGPQPDEWQIEVPSDSTKKVYTVRFDRVSHVFNLKEHGVSKVPEFACTCQDYLVRRKPTGMHCKHINQVINHGRSFGQPTAKIVTRPAGAVPVPASVYDHALGAL